MGQAAHPAVPFQCRFGQHQVSPARNAKIGPAITNDDPDLAQRVLGELTFAIAGEGTAVAPGMRESEPPAIAAQELEMVRPILEREAGSSQNARDREIQAVRHNGDLQPVLAAQRHEATVDSAIVLDATPQVLL